MEIRVQARESLRSFFFDWIQQIYKQLIFAVINFSILRVISIFNGYNNVNFPRGMILLGEDRVFATCNLVG